MSSERSGKGTTTIKYVMVTLLIINIIISSAAMMYVYTRIQALVTAPEEVTKTPIVMGTLIPVTGFGDYCGWMMLEAAKIAAEEINDAGGILGRPLVLYHEDSATDATQAVLGAKKLIEVNKVLAIVGVWTSVETLAVAPLCIEDGVVIMCTSGAEEISYMEDKDLVYRMETPERYDGPARALIGINAGAKRVAQLVVNNPWGYSAQKWVKICYEAKGAQIITSVVLDAGKTSYRTELEKLFEDNPDTVDFALWEAETLIVLKEAYELGLQPPNGFITVCGEAPAERYISEAGKAADGLLIKMPTPRDSPSYKHFVELFEERTGKMPDEYACETYDMVITCALAIEAAGTPITSIWKKSIVSVTNQPGEKVYTFKEGLEQIRAGGQIDYEGAQGPVNFDKYGDACYDYTVYKVIDGTLVKQYYLSVEEIYQLAAEIGAAEPY